MIIYSQKLAHYIRKKVINNIVIGNKYEIKGSFRRHATYITDIDIVNTVYPEYTASNIYDTIIRHINTISELHHIFIGQITCGTDDRFKLDTYDAPKINNIIKLLDKQTANKIESINESVADSDEKLFLINEIIWSNYKPRWSTTEIISNKKILSDGSELIFTEQIKKNASILIEYYIYIHGIPIGIDTFVKYSDIDVKSIYKSAADYYLKLSFYKKEYYYMLFPLRLYFRDIGKKQIQSEINNIIENTYGLYKQLLTFIQTYNHLSKINMLTYNAARSIVKYIAYYTIKLPNVSDTTIAYVKNIDLNLTGSIAIKSWGAFLTDIYDKIELDLHSSAKPMYEKYLSMVPLEDLRKVTYIQD